MAWGARNFISTQVLAARCFRRAGRPGLDTATALPRATVRLRRAMATVRLLRSTATRRLNRAMRRRASASRRRASRATSSCRRGRLREDRLRAATLTHRRNSRLTRPTPNRAARLRRTRRIHSKAASPPLTRLILSSKRRRRSSTAVLPRATEARRLNTAVRPRSSSTVRLRGNRSMALRKDNSLTAVALPRKGNNTARRRRPNNHLRTTARPPTQPAPTAHRLDPRGRRTEFAETIIPTFAETYRDML
jgi:hypothetical protein